MFIVPVREVVAKFSRTSYVTTPEPEPLSDDVMTMKLSLLAAFHAHPAAALTVTLPLPPLSVKEFPAGDSE